MKVYWVEYSERLREVINHEILYLGAHDLAGGTMEGETEIMA
jgi:hypothetical protein